MPRTLLVADPDASSLDRVARMARDAGYRVLTAGTRLQTVSALEACPIDGLLIDADLLRQCNLRRLLRRAPVLVLSVSEAGGIAPDVARVPKAVAPADLQSVLISLIGEPTAPRGRLLSIPLDESEGDEGSGPI